MTLSENDALCKPLLDFYNAHINDRDNERAGYIEDRFGTELRDPGPVFLLEKPWSRQIFTHADIYNDADKRTVIIEDVSINYKFESHYSRLLILKPGASPANAMKWGDPSVEVGIDFGEGGSSATPLDGSPYRLRKFPGFSEIEARRRSGDLKVRMPLIGQGIAQRIIVDQERLYVIARPRLSDPNSEVGAKALVYKILRSGHIYDVCYFELVK